MIFYVLDTNLILSQCLPPPTITNPTTPTPLEKDKTRNYNNRKKVFQHILTQWFTDDAILIVPNFIVSEVLNKLASYSYRESGLSKTNAKVKYEYSKNLFLKMISYDAKQTYEQRRANGRCFFNYELNRHHVLSLDIILPIEHTTEPLTVGTGKHGYAYLATFDQMLIAVAVELENILGEGRVFLATCDQRVAKVCSHESLPTCYLVNDAVKNLDINLPAINTKEVITVPKPAKVMLS